MTLVWGLLAVVAVNAVGALGVWLAKQVPPDLDDEEDWWW